MQFSALLHVDHVRTRSFPASIAPCARDSCLLFVAQGPADRAAQIATAPPVPMGTRMVLLNTLRIPLRRFLVDNVAQSARKGKRGEAEEERHRRYSCGFPT